VAETVLPVSFIGKTKLDKPTRPIPQQTKKQPNTWAFDKLFLRNTFVKIAVTTITPPLSI